MQRKMLVRMTQPILVTTILAACLAVPSFAQRGFGGQRWRLDPEDVERVWDAQSKSVAMELSLDEETAGNLAAAYKSSRERFQESFSSEPRGEGEWRERLTLVGRLREEEREKLKGEIQVFLSETQAGQALDRLGLYSFSWDRMTKSLLDLVSDEAVLQKAMLLTNSHVKKQEEEFSRGREDGDFEDRRERFRQLREKLNEELSKILSEEQMKGWKESTGRRAGRSES